MWISVFLKNCAVINYSINLANIDLSILKKAYSYQLFNKFFSGTGFLLNELQRSSAACISLFFKLLLMIFSIFTKVLIAFA